MYLPFSRNLGITDADVNLFNTEVGIMQELMWNGKPRLRVAFGERFRYWVHYGSLEEFLKRWKVEAVYHGN